MDNRKEVVVVGAARTAIGTFGGALKDFSASDLATIAVREAFRRANVEPASAQQIVLGNVIQCEPRDMYVSRVAGINAGMPKESAALTLNRLCGSGLQAIVSAANAIQLGDSEIAVGGGVETMSRAPYVMQSARWGTRMGDASMLDMLLGALQDPFGAGHMGITAENVAALYKISREEQDAFAAESQRKALAAIEAGYFKEQIVPVEVKGRKGATLFDTDEHPKAGTTVEALAKLRPAFKKEDGTVTAGNASGLNDGAPGVVRGGGSGSLTDGHRPDSRRKTGPATRRPESGGHGRDRIERGVRCPVARRLPRARPGSGQDQSQWRRDRARPPAWRQRRDHHREVSV